MKNNNSHHAHDNLEEIWHQVPPDYYQKGIENNILQRIWHTGKADAVLSMVKGSPARILDVGSAGGWFLSQIASVYPNAECFGIDVYNPAITYAKKLYPKIQFKVADGHKIPFADDSFDLVICTEVLEHVVNPEKVTSEIERVLKKKGIAVIEMDSGNVLFRVVWHWWTNMRKGVWRDSHIHTFSTNKLEKLLKKSNLQIKKKKTFNFTMGVVFLLEK